jgi:hypothetical protein
MSRDRREARIVRLDLGCGTSKAQGFVGADRYALDRVDVVLDLDGPLPFRSDSVDLVVMSHSLEHVRDVISVLQEVYRVCRHRAQVCIVAPYSHQALNLANPYHLQVFNEHTPRFWTDSPTSRVPVEEYAHPHAPHWGLARSDNSDPGIDFRCLGMELFYFSGYRGLSEEEKRTARRNRLDVCDQILYQLIVAKEPLDDTSPETVPRARSLYEPAALTLRRVQDRGDGLEAQLAARDAEIERLTGANVAADAEVARLSGQCAGRDAELGQTKREREAHRAEAARLRTELEGGRAEVARRGRKLDARKIVVSRLRAEIEVRKAEAARLRAEIELEQAETARLAADLATCRSEASRLGKDVEARDARLARARDEIEGHKLELRRAFAEVAERSESIRALETRIGAAAARQAAEVQELASKVRAQEQELGRWRTRGLRMAGELETFRKARLTVLLERFSRSDARNQIAPPFQQLVDDSLIFQDVRRFRLQPSPDLSASDFVPYPLPPLRAGLVSFLLATSLDVPAERGVIGLEIVSPENTIVAQTTLPLSEVWNDAPSRFTFGPRDDLGRPGYWLRVFTRDPDVPVRVFEWQRRRWGGLGRTLRLLFCGFVFTG